MPLQTTEPFSVQAPELPPAEGVEGVEGVAGEPVPAGTVGAAGDGAVGEAVTVTSVVEVPGTVGAAEGATDAALEAPGAKTPPPLDGRGDGSPPATDVGAVDGAPPAGEDGSAGVEPDEPHPLPVGGFRSFVAPFCTTLPGSGNWTAKFGTDLQESSRLIFSMSGSFSKALLSSEPPVTSIGAQFM